MRTKILAIQIFILILSATFIMAQKDNSVNDKLNNIKGEVNKIVISTDKGDVTFEGEDAKEILKKIKSHKIKKIQWISEDGEDIDIDGENVMIFKSGKGEKHIIKEFKDADNVLIMKHGDDENFDLIENGTTIKVEVQDEDGKKIVTVTTNEDGEERVETFEGKKADEYLDKMEKEHEMIIDVDVDSDDNHVWVKKLGDENKTEKDVKIEIKDGVKKITETTTENGEKKVKVYEGDEAEKYLKENNENDKHIMIEHKMKDGSKHKKVIIKEKIEEEK